MVDKYTHRIVHTMKHSSHHVEQQMQFKRVDVFSKARHCDVWKRADTIKSGHLQSMNGINSSTSFKVTIPIKIDLRRFLVLDSIRYLPAFAGNIQLKIKFSSEAMQVTPLSIEDYMKSPALLRKLTNYPAITNKFIPFEEEIVIPGTLTLTGTGNLDTTTCTGASLNTVNVSFSKTNSTISETYSYLHSFSLDPNVYGELVERYSQKALSFPIKEVGLYVDGWKSKQR